MKPATNAMADAVISIASAVLSTEDADDRTIAAMGRLIATTADARVNTRLAGHRAQGTLEAMAQQLAHRIAGRAAVVEIHAQLGRLAKAEGEGPDTWGPAWPCPDGNTKGMKPPLKMVG